MIMQNMKNIYCPNCNSTHWIEHFSMSTAMGWVQEYENGLPINSNPNIITTKCTCCECHHDFTYKVQYGEILDIIDEGEKPQVPVIKMPPINWNEEQQLTVKAGCID